MQIIGTQLLVHQVGAPGAVDDVYMDSEMVWQMTAGQRCSGLLFFAYYAPAGGLKARIHCDNAPLQILFGAPPANGNLTNVHDDPFTAIGPSTLGNWTVPFYIMADLTTMVRVQFAQVTTTPASPTHCLTGSYVTLKLY